LEQLPAALAHLYDLDTIPPETPLRATVYSAMRAMERDLIRRV